MKKIILTLALCMPFLAFSQAFKLTPIGFVNSSDTSKKYIVIEVPNKSSQELFKTSLLYFTSKYNSPKDVISKVEGSAITINGFQQNTIRQNGTATPFDINYTIAFQFKDGKIKIDAPTFRLNTGLRTMYLVYTGFSINGQESGIYGKNGKVKSEKAIIDLEMFFNDYLGKYNKELLSKSD